MSWWRGSRDGASTALSSSSPSGAVATFAPRLEEAFVMLLVTKITFLTGSLLQVCIHITFCVTIYLTLTH